MSDPNTGNQHEATERGRSAAPVQFPGFYFVAFIDLLGQSDELAQIGRIPKSEEERNQFFTTMIQVGTVTRNVRDSFSTYFSTMSSLQPSVEHIRPDKREEFTRINARMVLSIGFSDSFVVSLPLQAVTTVPEPEGFARSATSLWHALLGLACMSLSALQQGIPLRGGIDVGLGTEMFPNEVYGPALLNAYRLESQVAEYPRTALGENLGAYLAMLEQLPQDVPLNEYTKNMVGLCRKLICAAPDDGWPMLHFLSPVVMDAPGNFVAAKRVASDWVRGRINHYRTERNGKLFRRYVRLARYFGSYP